MHMWLIYRQILGSVLYLIFQIWWHTKNQQQFPVIHLSLLLPLRENLLLSIHFHSLPQKKSKLSRFLIIR
ncbi:hypothetical protein AXF42_Ash011528 [Apostasia shenzhenica]|uniref:Uncharacterized protein n=1 Tax=Apostasia shenzhenica TaxID=1088818 RepID=A0A2I0BAV8_9ASPA|nr:hypothetical protein AXF42_Ash011528 [Apostasia shenzhenica]